MQIGLTFRYKAKSGCCRLSFVSSNSLRLQQPEFGHGLPPRPRSGIAPQQQGGLPPKWLHWTDDRQHHAHAGWTASASGMGEPVTGEAGFPIDYTPLTPFGPALTELAGTGVHGAAANEPSSGVAPGEQPGPGAITLDEAMQILSGIEKLKGQVFLLEDIVDRGFTEGKVVVGLTNMIDKATITNAIRTTKLYGWVRFVDISDGVPTGAIPVAGQVAQAA